MVFSVAVKQVQSVNDDIRTAKVAKANFYSTNQGLMLCWLFSIDLSLDFGDLKSLQKMMRQRARFLVNTLLSS